MPAGRVRFCSMSTERCVVLCSLFFTVFSNNRFWQAWSAGHDWAAAETWLLAAVMAVLLTAVHSLLLGLVVTRRTAKPLLSAVFAVTALAAYYMNHYTVFFDASMVRNVFHTDFKEAHELLSMGMLGAVLTYGVLPSLVLWRAQFTQRSLFRAVTARLVFLLGTVAVGSIAIMIAFQDLSALMRNQKELRYLITPADFIVSTLKVALAERDEGHTARVPVGLDARSANVSSNGKPRLLVVVVGETARAANWGLNGYVRQTTPQLAATGVINFSHVTSCGTNTEVSVPCMFSPFGRKSYDEKKIRRHESVLHVLEHGGIKTLWRDNQSGCKGVCDGLETQRPEDTHDPLLCKGEHCFDEVLLKDLASELQTRRRDIVIVLHQLGNHGPSYSHRYPGSYRRFTPTCENADLGKCLREEIVNSYDNAILYTDHFLAETIRQLQSQQTHNAAMIYVSDHGESLGEKGIYLHGLPYAIAPREQTEVPMVMWLSQDFAAASRIDVDCMRKRASQPASHDNLFHSLLGMMGVSTAVYDAAFDLTSTCRL
ncbi:hypothetical protein ASE07_08895 [Noviherbaspirillum sp. Root189]|nr:hypothetical protein ASE07_08895 [Noviherbaspirillum sp. Root189]